MVMLNGGSSLSAGDDRTEPGLFRAMRPVQV